MGAPEETDLEISGRNQIKDRISSMIPCAVNTIVKIDIGGGNIVISSITEEAVADLALAEDDDVTVIVKASDVLIGK